MVASVRAIAACVDTAIRGLNFPQLSHSEACHSEAYCFFGVRAHNQHQTTIDGHTQCIATLISTAISDADGKASESSDHKNQTYDAVVMHLQNPDANAHVDTLTADTATGKKDDGKTETHEVLRDVDVDVDVDGYFENTQWVDAKDAQGNTQGLLVLDRNDDGRFETADLDDAMKSINGVMGIWQEIGIAANDIAWRLFA